MDNSPKLNELVDIDPSEQYSKKKNQNRSTKNRKTKAILEFKQAVSEEAPSNQPILEEEVVVVQPIVVQSIVEQEIAEPKEETNHIVSTEEINITDNKSDNNNDVKDNDTIDNKNIVDLFKDSINNHSIVEKVSVKLDEKTKDCFMYILQTYPDDLDGFNKLILMAIEDGKMDMQDLPVIINLCRKIYELISKTNVDYKTAIECSRLILKFIIRILINEKKIKIRNDNIPSFLNGFDNLVDVCLDMLIERRIIENGCSSFFKKMLCKKR